MSSDVSGAQVLAVVQSAIESAIATVLERDPATVTRASRFRDDLAADSLALAEITQIVEQALVPVARPGFRVEDEELDGLGTVGDAVDHLVEKL